MPSYFAKKMKRRRKRFDSEIQEDADDLLATGSKKHRLRIGDAAIHGGSKASKQSGKKSASGSKSDDATATQGRYCCVQCDGSVD